MNPDLGPLDHECEAFHRSHDNGVTDVCLGSRSRLPELAIDVNLAIALALSSRTMARKWTCCLARHIVQSGRIRRSSHRDDVAEIGVTAFCVAASSERKAG